MNSDATPLIRTINNVLRKNRRILVALLDGADKPVLVDKERLVTKGFHFEFFTEQFRNEKEEVYYYCYDVGYRALDATRVMVVKNRKREFGGRRRRSTV